MPGRDLSRRSARSQHLRTFRHELKPVWSELAQAQTQLVFQNVCGHVLNGNVCPNSVKNWCLLRQICLHRYWLPKTPLRWLEVTVYELCTHTLHLYVYTLSYSIVYILSYNFVCTVFYICMGAHNFNAYFCMWTQFCFHVYNVQCTVHFLCASVRADNVIKFCVHMDILWYNFVCMWIKCHI